MEGNGDLFGTFNIKTNMAIVVPNSNKSLELGPPTSSVCFCLLEPHPLGIHPEKIILDFLAGMENRQISSRD